MTFPRAMPVTTIRAAPVTQVRPALSQAPAPGVGGDHMDVLRAVVAQGGVLALTGAGMSTDSGIPDYRGPDGLRRVTPMTIEEFRASSRGRQRYWSRAYVGWSRFRAAQPNDAHRAVATLEHAGVLDSVITQNVDGLHQESGSRRVRELHGTLARVVCLACDAQFDRDRLQAALTRLNPGFTEQSRAAGTRRVAVRPDGDVDIAPSLVRQFRTASCEDCGSDLLKPDVVFFGESVPRPLVAECFDAVESCRALLVLGSSLAVMSGLRFVRRAATLGRPVVIVTRGPSRGDDLSTVRIDAPLGEVLPWLARTVAALGPGPSAASASASEPGQTRRRTAVTLPSTVASSPAIGS
ncbi:MAG: Sir2 family NAD-dependent protein deacetylase [Micrococcales bacterium]|nr:Sir2 family NAD-dependent protein deacetylase [Micrococcales bacterium]